MLWVCGAFLLVGCDGTSVSFLNRLAFDSQQVVFGTMLGEEEGAWVFDATTLRKQAELTGAYGPERPFRVEPAPSLHRWYAYWNEPGDTGNRRDVVLKAINTRHGTIVRHVTLEMDGRAWQVQFSLRKQHLLLYSPTSDTLHLLDPNTLQRRRRVSLPLNGEGIHHVAVDPDGRYYIGSVSRIHVYDPSSTEPHSSFPITSLPILSDNALTDLELSPDGEWAYVTSYSPRAGGAFSVINAATGDIRLESPAGSYAELAVHPNGRWVFVDCPAGGMRTLIPVERVLQYNTAENTVTAFWGPEDSRRINQETLILSSVRISPDGQSLVFVNRVPTVIRYSEDTPRAPTLFRVNIQTKEVEASYHMPRDSEGYAVAGIGDLAMSPSSSVR